MSEVVATFCTTDGWRERADPAAQATNSPLGDLSQEGFEFAERHLDRIKVRRVLRQILHRCAKSFVTPALQPFDRRAGADLKALGRLRRDAPASTASI